MIEFALEAYKEMLSQSSASRSGISLVFVSALQTPLGSQVRLTQILITAECKGRPLTV
jgi:hypothetical protein